MEKSTDFPRLPTSSFFHVYDTPDECLHWAGFCIESVAQSWPGQSKMHFHSLKDSLWYSLGVGTRDKEKGGCLVGKYPFQLDMEKLDCILEFAEEITDITDMLSNSQ